MVPTWLSLLLLHGDGFSGTQANSGVVHTRFASSPPTPNEQGDRHDWISLQRARNDRCPDCPTGKP
jgi:hypothetical protein